MLTAVLLIWNRPLLLAFGASGNTIGYAVQYMQIYALGTLFVELTLGLNAFITAQGFARVGMKTVLIGAVCNILLDPLFIFALDMGVRGAALATVLSQAVSCVWVVTFLRGRPGRGGHDHSLQRHAVCHAAPAGHRPGGPAHLQL